MVLKTHAMVCMDQETDRILLLNQNPPILDVESATTKQWMTMANARRILRQGTRIACPYIRIVLV